MTSHDFKIYNDDLYLKFYSKSSNYKLLNELQRPFKQAIDYYEKGSRVNNTDTDNPLLPWSIPIPEHLNKLGLLHVILNNYSLSVNYNEHNFEIIIYPSDYFKTKENLKFTCTGYSMHQDVQNFIESFILNDQKWNFILLLIDANKVTNLLEGGISDFFGTKKMVKEYES